MALLRLVLCVCVCVLDVLRKNKGFAGIRTLQQTNSSRKLVVAPSDTWSAFNLTGPQGWVPRVEYGNEYYCFCVIIFKSLSLTEVSRVQRVVYPLLLSSLSLHFTRQRYINTLAWLRWLTNMLCVYVEESAPPEMTHQPWHELANHAQQKPVCFCDLHLHFMRTLIVQSVETGLGLFSHQHKPPLQYQQNRSCNPFITQWRRHKFDIIMI